MRKTKTTHDLAAVFARKASADLRAMTVTLRAGVWEASCFHAQQAVEKFLKAYLVSRGETFPFTHDLLPLLTQAAKSNLRLHAYAGLARRLTPYAVQVRYVGVVSPTKAQATSAARRAEVFCRFVVALLPKAVQPKRGKKR